MQSATGIWLQNRCIWRQISSLVDHIKWIPLLAVMRRAQSAIFLFISFLFPSTRCAHHACSNLMYSCFHSNIHALRVFLVCISWIRVAVAVAVAVTEIAYRYFKKRACMQHCAQSHIASMVSTSANFGRGRRPHFATCGDSSNLLTISTYSR